MSDAIPFLKVQGAGNDFVLIDARGPNAALSALDWESAADRICNRNFGIGAPSAKRAWSTPAPVSMGSEPDFGCTPPRSTR